MAHKYGWLDGWMAHKYGWWDGTQIWMVGRHTSSVCADDGTMGRYISRHCYGRTHTDARTSERWDGRRNHSRWWDNTQTLTVGWLDNKQILVVGQHTNTDDGTTNKY